MPGTRESNRSKESAHASPDQITTVHPQRCTSIQCKFHLQAFQRRCVSIIPTLYRDPEPGWLVQAPGSRQMIDSPEKYLRKTVRATPAKGRIEQCIAGA